ncbi:M50 family metallopeptidase [Galactobacter sp.]|uniref:M50 family metallopeptidase n=1 Tax=Galactobacter sp. TaxID=2676125 RepID=UPI0025BF3A16|nr:M50 family metallopeptidase [Galactobacter sp.]
MESTDLQAADIWPRLLDTLTVSNPVPEAGRSAAIALILAAALVFVPGVWRFSGLVVTVVHELGHGFAGLLRGRRSVAISVRTDHSGQTVSRGTAGSAPFSTFCGYPAPAIYGLLLVWAALSQRAGLALVISGALLLVSLIFMRGWLAWLLSIAVVALSAWLALYTPDEWLGYVVGGIGIFFLLGALRGFGNLTRAHARGDRTQSDAAVLASITRAPAGLWLFLMGVVILGCLAAAAWLLWTTLSHS